jgi:hypothetical protein
MDAKNIAALDNGPEWMLAKFTNLRADGPSTDVQEFYEKYGDLYPGLGADAAARKRYSYFVSGFQFAWGAKNRTAKEIVSKFITDIFERDITAEKLGLLRASPFDDPDDPESRPVIDADFESGKIRVRPRTMLDQLAKWLLECRNKLAVCQWKNCETPYYVKKHPRYKYCSTSCAEKAGRERKSRWWRDSRGKNKRQGERKVQRQRKRQKSFSRDAPVRQHRTRP